MKPWTKEKIEEAATFSWVLYNKDGKPMVDATCNRCGKRFQHESTEDNMLPVYCSECTSSFLMGVDLANGKDFTIMDGKIID